MLKNCLETVKINYNLVMVPYHIPYRTRKPFIYFSLVFSRLIYKYFSYLLFIYFLCSGPLESDVEHYDERLDV